MAATYAVLGATGNCGTALIKNLLNTPDVRINAYCRSQPKLVRLMPEATENKRLKIFDGSISDVELIKACVKDTKAVFFVASMNDNMPGCRVGQDSADSVIAALKQIKSEDTMAKMPKLIVLSSATIDPFYSRNMPWWFHPIMIRAGSYVYEDLRVMEEMLRSHEDLVKTVFVKPGGLAVDVSRGYQLSFDDQESFIAYLDLSAAMIEAADDTTGLYEMKNVSVKHATGSSGAAFPPGTPMCILLGILRHYFPALHPYLPTSGPA